MCVPASLCQSTFERGRNVFSITVIIKTGYLAYLSARCGMAINDRVDTMLSTNVNGAVEMFESFWFEHSGIHVILKVSVVDCDTNAI